MCALSCGGPGLKVTVAVLAALLGKMQLHPVILVPINSIDSPVICLNAFMFDNETNESSQHLLL